MQSTPAPPYHPFVNPAAGDWTYRGAQGTDPAVLAFHQTLPAYRPTPLVSLPSLARALGLRSLYLKDESDRFGLPSFKILGASWAIYRAICSQLDLPADTSLETASTAARANGVSLVSCSDGNWGRSVGRMAKIIGLAATIFVPQNIDQATRDKISGEGATCLVSPGDYDASIAAARKLAAETKGGLLVMDTSWPGYTDIPRSVTEGYSTMLAEVSSVVPEPTLVIVSVGVGSWAHSVVVHYRRPIADGSSRKTTVATVEPIAAPSLLTSLHRGDITPIETADTIMCGMNCGTTSTIAWPILEQGVGAAVAVTDHDAHLAVQELKAQADGLDVQQHRVGHATGEAAPTSASIDPGPCGAAPLAALRQILQRRLVAGLDEAADVVLFCTEGAREYVVSSA